MIEVRVWLLVPVIETPCSVGEVQSSFSQQLQQMRNECCGQFAGVKLGMTRAALDQKRREQRALY